MNQTFNNTNVILESIDFDLLQKNPHQPRRVFNEEKLNELAQSIRDEGLIQPIVARKLDDHYEIIAGERRWRACQLARIKKVPVLIRTFTDQQSAIAAISENTQRENLNLMEMAHAFARLNKDFSMTHETIGKHFKINTKNVTHILRLLKLDAKIQNHITSGDLSLGHAKVILTVTDANRIELAQTIIKKKLSVRSTEKLAKKITSPCPTQPSTKDPDVQRLENAITEQVGLINNIKYETNGTGKIEFSFSSFSELDGLLDKLNVSL